MSTKLDGQIVDILRIQDKKAVGNSCRSAPQRCLRPDGGHPYSTVGQGIYSLTGFPPDQCPAANKYLHFVRF